MKLFNFFSRNIFTLKREGIELATEAQPKPEEYSSSKEWDNTSKEIIEKDILEPIFKFIHKYIFLLKSDNGKIGYQVKEKTIQEWENKFILKKQENKIDWNYLKIEQNLDSEFLKTFNNLLLLVPNLEEKNKTIYHELEEDYKKIQDIFKNNIKEFEMISAKEAVINALITSTFNSYYSLRTNQENSDNKNEEELTKTLRLVPASASMPLDKTESNKIADNLNTTTNCTNTYYNGRLFR